MAGVGGRGPNVACFDYLRDTTGPKRDSNAKSDSSAVSVSIADQISPRIQFLRVQYCELSFLPQSLIIKDDRLDRLDEILVITKVRKYLSNCGVH